MHIGAEAHGMWVLFSSLQRRILLLFTLHNVDGMLGSHQMISLAGMK